METKKNKYAFQTIVATPEIRSEFTQLRDALDSSDKQLMKAIWAVVQSNLEQIRELVNTDRELIQLTRESKREEKKAAKPKPAKAPKAAKKPKVEKAPKKVAKATKPAKAPKESHVIDSDDDVMTTVEVF